MPPKNEQASSRPSQDSEYQITDPRVLAIIRQMAKEVARESINTNSKPRPQKYESHGWPLQETSYQYKTPYYDSNKQPATQTATTSPAAYSATSSITQTTAQSSTQLQTQQATLQEPPQAVIQQTTPQKPLQSSTQLTTQRRQATAFEEALKVAITTPLPKALECRRCFAEFSSNSQLHKHIRESHSKKTAAERSAAKSIAPCDSSLLKLTPAESTSKVIAAPSPTSASKSQPPLKCNASSLSPSEITPSLQATTQIALSADQVTPQTALSAHQITPQAATSATLVTPRSVTPPSTYRAASPLPEYRAVSPSPPTYETASKNYLTMADLYMRYAPLKSAKSKSAKEWIRPMATRSRTSTHLTAKDADCLSASKGQLSLFSKPGSGKGCSYLNPIPLLFLVSG